MMGWFEQKQNPVNVQVNDEWIWVTGFKGTESDMTCRDFQYEMNKVFEMPAEQEIKECESGFHLCLNLGDVFSYYRIMNGNRFFKVRALVRASDVERYGHDTEEYQDYLSNRARYSFYGMYPGRTRYDKLVARSIVFEQELTPDEILGNYVADLSEWPDDIKQYALKFGVDLARKKMQHEKLAELGYSEAFARHLIAIDKYDVAVSVGSQADLSMDMKCAIIFNK